MVKAKNVNVQTLHRRSIWIKIIDDDKEKSSGMFHNGSSTFLCITEMIVNRLPFAFNNRPAPGANGQH